MLRFGICEDEVLQLDIMEKYIRNWAHSRNVAAKIMRFSTAEEMLYHWSPNNQFDLLFLDIQLENMSGVQLAKIVRKLDNKQPLVFVTGHADYVFEGYNVGALDFLLKPVTAAACEKCLDRLLQSRSEQPKDSIVFSIDGKLNRFYHRDIYYFEAHDRHVFIHTAQGELQLDQRKLSGLEGELPNERYVRAHRSYIVNVQRVDVVEKSRLIFDDGTYVPVSHGHWQAVYSVFLNWFEREGR